MYYCSISAATVASFCTVETILTTTTKEDTKASFTPAQHVARQHVVRNMLLVARNMLLQATCCLLPATCCLLPSTKLLRGRATCCRQQATCCPQYVACCPQHVARPRNLLPRNMLRWCKCGLKPATIAVNFKRSSIYAERV